MTNCPYCASPFHVKDGFDSVTGDQRYRCKFCGRKYGENSKGRAKPIKLAPVMIKCLQCGKETSNPKFCNSSCAATYTNKAHRKRKAKARFCKYCGTILTGKRQVTCEACNPNVVNWMDKTLGEVQRSAQYQVSAHLRTIARNLYQKANLPRLCANCGYDKHVEICHIKPINTFDEAAPVAVINDLANLIALCPNCHWEFDNGTLHL